jgi:hypothetical protein
LLRHPEAAAEKGLRGGGAEADDDLRPHDGRLLLQPRARARGDLGGVRLRVDAPRAVHVKCSTAFVT